jgi:crotonobetainyl-CoA:carnitine CoA-transferase CaiB-like acyl-CoA transferase
MTQPLEGLRILDFTRVLAGPFATMILGDIGAEVIKAEPPNGDESRSWPPILKKGESGYFLSLNRNEVFTDENVLEREMMFTLDHPIEGIIEQLGFPFKFSQTPAEANLRPPLLGEHNEEVLSWLGYSSQEIESFKAAKVI